MRIGYTESVFSVKVESGATVGDLKEAIKARMGHEFAHLRANQLALFLAKRGDDWLSDVSDEVNALYQGDASKVRGLIKTPLKPTYIIDDLFKDLPDKTIHFLVVDPDHPTCHPIRRKRWRELNERLDRIKRPRSNGTSTTGFSHMKWSDVEDVLDYTTYTQKRKEVPADRLMSLYEHLMLTTKMMGKCTTDRNERKKEAKCYHFIAPVLIYICDLLGDDAKILIEEVIKGDKVHGHGVFDFVVQSGNKKFCIVVAKKEDYFQGATEALIGCETVADREGLETVYAIVTDFVQWQFYRSGETKIEQHTYCLGISSGVIRFDSFKDLCELLYGLLAEELE